VIHGNGGISQKATGEGRASHYYSFTRLKTTGRLEIDGKAHEVSGSSWFDHEWATNQLAAEQVGWNWFSIQLSDSTELMLYQMRTRDGGADRNSSGTFVTTNGEPSHLTHEAYRLTPLSYWKSSQTGANYPVSWHVEIPSLRIDLKVETPLAKQELVIKPISYWEGAIKVRGTRGGLQIGGQGYMELTGYAAPLVGIRSPTNP
jgi:predicted secreted hydrolase